MKKLESLKKSEQLNKNSLDRLLSEEEQDEFYKNVLTNDEVKKLIFSAEVCLLAKNIPIKTVNTKLVKEIKKIKFNNTVSPAIWRNLDSIFKQILESLQEQRILFIDQLAHKFLSSYEPGLESNSGPFQKLLQLFKESCENLDLSKDKCILELSEEERKSLGSAQESINFHQLFHKFYRKVAPMLIIFFSALGGHEVYSQGELQFSNFQIRNTILIAILSLMYIYGYKSINSMLEDEKKIASEKTFPEFKLKNIKVVKFSSGKIKEDYYKPDFKVKTPEPPTTQLITNNQEEKPGTPLKSKRRHHSKPETSSFDRKKTVQSSVQWSKGEVLLGEANEIISSDELTEMKGRSGAKHVRYFGFFNRAALAKQGLTETDEEWIAYENEIDKGNITKDKSGLKPLIGSVSTRVKLNGKDYGRHEYKYEARIVGKKYRLLGKVCGTVTDEQGVKCKLVDFNWHLQEGLH